MSIRILTKNSVENTNIDGARAYNFDAGNRSGILEGVLNEGDVYSPTTNKIALKPCELRLCGHRIVIDEEEVITLLSTPVTDKEYSLIAEISVSESVPTFRIFIQPSTTEITQDNLFLTNSGDGTVQIKLATFTQTTTGNIQNIVKNASLINGTNITSTSVIITETD